MICLSKIRAPGKHTGKAEVLLATKCSSMTDWRTIFFLESYSSAATMLAITKQIKLANPFALKRTYLLYINKEFIFADFFFFNTIYWGICIFVSQWFMIMTPSIIRNGLKGWRLPCLIQQSLHTWYMYLYFSKLNLLLLFYH